LHRLREQLLELLSQLEAGLDFVDEDIEFISQDSLRRELAAAETALATIANQIRGRGESQEEPRVVLWGCPNVGKSSLLNALAGNDAAIVSDMAGTTRDYVTRQVVIDGLSMLLVDTAGIGGPVEFDALAAASQQRTQQQLTQAALILLCLDASRPLNAWELDQLSQLGEVARLVVLTKSDLAVAPVVAIQDAILTSCRNGTGIDSLRTAIRTQLLQEDQTIVPHTAIRCRESLRLAGECLARASEAVQHALGDELIAAELRQALDELGIVVGAVYTDDILDRIFSRFCIGK
jgi:tRNA modification GTPase